jgi:acyl-coenzyme A thioesterase PaaI-like protein
VSSQLSDPGGRGFDNELGLTYRGITPDGVRAQLEIHDKLLQPWGIVHGGVYCAIIESLSSLPGRRGCPRTGAAASSGSTTTPTSYVQSRLARSSPRRRQFIGAEARSSG